MDFDFRIRTRVRGPLFREGAERLRRNVREGVDRLATFAREEVLRQIRRSKPYPPIFTGTFLGSVAKSVDLAPGGGVRAAVGTPVAYGPVIEEGRRPGRFPPLAPLRVWTREVLGDEGLAFVVARKIARKGVKPRPVFRGAVPAVQERVQSVFEGVLLEGLDEGFVE
ncbi:MAG: hypothetical protein ACE5IM_08145 [Nitrospinota bacterium]